MARAVQGWLRMNWNNVQTKTLYNVRAIYSTRTDHNVSAYTKKLMFELKSNKSNNEECNTQ